MSRDLRLYLDDILEAIAPIRRHVGRMDFDAFRADEKTVDAVIRNLEVNGEAARNLPESLRTVVSEVEWRKRVALRNLLIHEYFGISLEILWDILQHKLDSLGSACRRFLGSKGPASDGGRKRP